MPFGAPRSCRDLDAATTQDEVMLLGFFPPFVLMTGHGLQESCRFPQRKTIRPRVVGGTATRRCI